MSVDKNRNEFVQDVSQALNEWERRSGSSGNVVSVQDLARGLVQVAEKWCHRSPEALRDCFDAMRHAISEAEGTKDERDVFAKLEVEAPVLLTAKDVRLLRKVCGSAITQGGKDYETWKYRFAEYFSEEDE